MNKISIITINYNGLADTCALIESIPENDNVEIIVVDNASRTDEASIISNRYPHISVVRSTCNLGFAGGNNLGIKAATGKYLFFLNNDTVMEGTDTQKLQSLQQLVSRLESSESIGVVCPKIRFYQGQRLIQFAGYTPLSSVTVRNQAIGCGEADQGQYDIPHPTPYAHGAAMMVKREAIDKAGLMPECYFLYYEELDWSMMFHHAGYELWYDPALTIFHKESQTTGQESPLRTYYITRNRLLFARRNIGLPTRIMTYCYLMGLVIARDLCKYVIKRHIDLCRSSLLAVGDFLKGHTGYRSFS